MEHSYRFRIYPTKEQTIQIQRTFGCCRFVYNYYLSKRIDAYKTDKTTLGYKACSADMTALKKQLFSGFARWMLLRCNRPCGPWMPPTRISFAV